MVCGWGLWVVFENANKYYIWELMRNLKWVYFCFMVYFRDFNEIISMLEKDGGVLRGERYVIVF